MNPSIPDWNFDFEPPLTNLKRNFGQDNDLVELLWQNGQVVMHSQTNRKASPNRSDTRELYKHNDPGTRAAGSNGNSCNMVQDDETASWIHYPVEDSFEKEFCSHFFGELPSANPMDIDKPLKQVDHDKFTNFGSFTASSQQSNIRNAVVPEIPGSQMPPPRFQLPDLTRPAHNSSSGGPGKIVNFSQFTLPSKGEIRPSNFQIDRQGSGVSNQVDFRECSVMTVGSSHCGSNQIPNDNPDRSHASSNGVGTAGCVSAGMVKEDDCHILSLSQNDGRKTETLEPTVTSSSGGSGSSFGATTRQHVSAGVSHKRKGREGEESEGQSEAVEIESASGKKPIQRSGSTRRSRAAEVHNLSERRRRDRINKKMKALQELIPHCNKTDKASMLDEAIEYLKSLQLQLQVMWMGGGMAPMMFPGAQHYLSSMGVTMCPPTMPAVHANMHLPRIPMVDQSFPVAPSTSQAMFGQTPVLNPVNFPSQMANPSFPDQFMRYMGIHNMQTPSQPLNMFKLGSQVAQQNQQNSQPGSCSGPHGGGTAAGATSSKIG